MLTDITLGQYYPGNSCIHRLDPRTKILAVLFYMVMVFLANSPLSYGILIGFIVLGAALAKLPAGLLLRSIKPLWIIILLTMVIHFVTDPGEALWHWKFITVTREGIVLGVKMSLRLVLLLLVSSLMTFTTSPIVLTDGIESLLRPFKKIGVPAHELAMMMTIALRFIPTLLEGGNRPDHEGPDVPGGGFFLREHHEAGQKHAAHPDSPVHLLLPPGGRTGSGHGSPVLPGRGRTDPDA